MGPGAGLESLRTSSPINELHRLPQKRQSTTYSHHDSDGTTAWCGRYITHCRTGLTFQRRETVDWLLRAIGVS